MVPSVYPINSSSSFQKIALKESFLVRRHHNKTGPGEEDLASCGDLQESVICTESTQ